MEKEDYKREIIKEVQLTPTEAKNLRTKYKNLTTLKDSIPSIVAGMLEEIEHREDELWDWVAEKLDIENPHFNEPDKRLSIDWLSEKIYLEKRGDLK